jgi:hypothetical protein
MFGLGGDTMKALLLLIGILLSACSSPSASSPTDVSAPAVQSRPYVDAPSPAASNAAQLFHATKTEFDGWNNCTTGAAIRYLDAKETAEVVARAAMTSCAPQEAAFQQAVIATNRTLLSEYQIMNIYRSRANERLVEMIIRNRQNLAVAKIRSEAWVDCLFNATGTLASADRSNEEIIKAAFLACREREYSMRAQLASFLGPSSIVEERKAKVLPILMRYVEKVRTAKGSRPERPELSI